TGVQTCALPILAMKRTAKEAFGDDSLEGKTIAVLGVGNVSYNLCSHLHEEGAKLVVTDISQDAIDRAVNDFGAKAVGIEEIYDVESDIYVSCDIGGILNDETI